jgi:ABC-type bacteriocin/lantibiotic exporter with double-glycine peptidase domain
METDLMLRSLWKVAQESWGRLERRGRITLVVYTASMILTSALDGVALFLLDSLLGAAEDSQPLMSDSPQLWGGVVVVGLFVVRSAVAAGLTWFGYSVFAREEVRVGDENLAAYLDMEWAVRSKDQLSDINSLVDRGPFAMVQQLLLPIGTTIAEIVNALVIFAVLLVLDPLTAFVTVVFFLLVAVIQHRVLSVSMSRAGGLVASEMNATYDLLSDAFHLGKVLKVMPSMTLGPEVSRTRGRLARARAWTIFLESLPRYLMESMLAVGVVVIGITTVLARGSEALLPALSVFGIAGFRLLPIVNRIQGLVLSFLGREPLVRLALRDIPTRRISFGRVDGPSPGAERPAAPVLTISDVHFTYPEAASSTLAGVSLEFERGKQYAIVGPSGSGKTTLLDVCMGILTPTSGTINWVLDSEETVGYVPQDSHISSTGIPQNVALEWSTEQLDESLVVQSMTSASLAELTGHAPHSQTPAMSGGQRQRLGLARALYRQASILFLDEPTSSLDASTEAEVMDSLHHIRGGVTVVIVAHRLSTVQKVDEVIYLENGRVLGRGSFNELRKELPQFERQIQLSTIEKSA